MQCLEISGAVRLIYWSLGVKGLNLYYTRGRNTRVDWNFSKTAASTSNVLYRISHDKVRNLL